LKILQVQNLYIVSGLKPLEEKIDMINEFQRIFIEMCNSLAIINTTIISIDFDDPNFTTYYSRSAKDVIETLYKDIKVP